MRMDAEFCSVYYYIYVNPYNYFAKEILIYN